jgi:hypothetical protein
MRAEKARFAPDCQRAAIRPAGVGDTPPSASWISPNSTSRMRVAAGNERRLMKLRATIRRNAVNSLAVRLFALGNLSMVPRVSLGSVRFFARAGSLHAGSGEVVNLAHNHHVTYARRDHAQAPPLPFHENRPHDGRFGRRKKVTVRLNDNSIEDAEGFRLSRIQAEGWAAARKYLSGGGGGDEQEIAALNPHRTDAERARWYAGFNSAIDRL